MRRTPCLLQAVLLCLAGAAPGMAADASCQPVLDALGKLRATPYHMAMTDSGGATAALNGGKPEQSETISIDDKLYLRIHGKWRVTDNPMRAAPDAEDKDQDARQMSCAYLHDDDDDAVWAVHEQTEDDRSDGQVWIAKATGLVQRQETDQDAGGGAMGKSHLSVRLDYTDIQPPPGM